MSKIKILVLSWEPWNTSNSFGNSYNSIFKGIENIEIANITCRYGTFDKKIVSRCYQMTEQSILKSIFKGSPSGQEVYASEDESHEDIFNKEQASYSKGMWSFITWLRRNRFILLFWLRDLIWWTGRWKSKELDDFIESFKPDVVWIPVYYSGYMNNIAMYLKKKTGKKMLCYISDDNYTLKQYSLSPMYWIDRLIKRRGVKRVIQNSEICYVITEKQKEEYEHIFNVKCKLLWKGDDFNVEKPMDPKCSSPLKMVFLGNSGLNRWKSILDVIDVIKEINANRQQILLDIYTMTPLQKGIIDKFNSTGNSQKMPPLASEKIISTFRDTDMLLHVEPTDLKNRLFYRLSFSTKLVDCFAAARCIIAYGGETGSMDYLRRHKCGIVANTKEDLKEQLLSLINDKQRVIDYGAMSWDIGKKFHNISNIQNHLYKDIEDNAY